MRWPADSKFKPLFDALQPLDRLPAGADFLQDWSRFTKQAKPLGFTSLADWQAQSNRDDWLRFPQLGQNQTATEKIIDQEILFRQVQYVVDYGRWCLLSDMMQALQKEHIAAFDGQLPFVFTGGGFEHMSLPEIRATLRSLQALADTFTSETLPVENGSADLSRRMSALFR